MKEKSVVIIIAIFFFILFFLLIITYLLSRQKTISQKNSSLKPTVNYQQNSLNFQNIKNQAIIPTSFQQQTTVKTETISTSSSKKLTDLITKLPLQTENFSADYLPLTNQIVFIPKNQQGYTDISNFLKENGLEELSIKNPELIKITNNDSLVNYQNEERAILANRDQSLRSPPPNLSPTNQPQDNFAILTDLLRIFFEFSQTASQINQTIDQKNQTTSQNFSLQPTPLPTLFNPQTYLHQPASASYNSLQNIFNEVGARVGVPPKILEAVLTIETPSTFNLTSDQINLYSTLGNVIPNCRPNVCSATGPMQMTIGIDNSGSSQCSACGLDSCPNAWRTYGNAVNIFTNENHQPNPCNLRDNIYGAAYKLKTDSGASDPLNWTQEQVFQASRRYYGSCSDSHRYARLGNRTYCEYVWWYYKNK